MEKIQLDCPQCREKVFHPIEVGEIHYNKGTDPFKIESQYWLTPTKRVYVCVNCGFPVESLDGPGPQEKKKLYVVSNSVSKASHELNSVDVMLSPRQYSELAKTDSVLFNGDVGVCLGKTFQAIVERAPETLQALDVEILTKSIDGPS